MQFHDGGGVGHSGWRHAREHGFVYRTAREAFFVGWDAINARRGFPFRSNPLVWKVTFRRVKP